MNIPDDLRYASSHEWVRIDDDGIATVGISDHAQEELTDLVYLELPEVGREVEAGEEIAVVESVKSASDIYSPIGGEVVEVNTKAEESPATINADPYGDGWLFRLKVSDATQLDDLLDANGYQDAIS